MVSVVGFSSSSAASSWRRYSACYLAAGRPVVLQATGFEDLLPTGEGVFAVHDVDEVAAAIAEVRGDYARHSHAARRLAEKFFDAESLLARMLEGAGLPGRATC